MASSASGQDACIWPKSRDVIGYPSGQDVYLQFPHLHYLRYYDTNIYAYNILANYITYTYTTYTCTT